MENLFGLAVLSGMLSCISSRSFADNILSLPRHFRGSGEGRIIGKPDIHGGPILHVVGEELSFQLLCHHNAQCQKNERSGENFPALLDGPCCHQRVKEGKSALAAILERKLRFCAWPQQVVSKERNKCH